MAEKNKFVVIDETPKRRPQCRVWMTLLFAILLFCAACDDASQPISLELTATALVQINATIIAQLTETASAIPASGNQSTITPNATDIAIRSMSLTQTPTGFTVTPSPSASPTATSTSISTSVPLPLTWARQELPEITAAAQAAFADVDILREVTVRVEAYGENCGGCSAASFRAMTTDFYLTTEVDDLDDLDAIAELITAAVDVLSAPLGVELPARLGYFDITLTAGDATGNLRIMFNQIEAARAQGLTGSALINELGGITQRP